MAGDGSKEQLFADAAVSGIAVVERLARLHEADPALRRELVQEILLAVWDALPGFRGEASIETFVAGIARRRCVTHVARRAREPRQVGLPADLICRAARPDETALHNERRRLLAQSIRLLPIPQREAVVLCLEGFSYGETATILGISPNAAMLRCRRAKGRLMSAVAGPS